MALEEWEIVRSENDEYIAHFSEHEFGEWVNECARGQRVDPGSGPECLGAFRASGVGFVSVRKGCFARLGGAGAFL